MEPIRKSEVINAALECICKVGIEKITLDMVAAQANCSKGVIAYYFKSKRNLTLEALKAFLSYYRVKSGGEINTGMKPDEMIKVVVAHGLPPYDTDLHVSNDRINVSQLEGIDKMYISSDKKAKLFIQFFSKAALDKDIQDTICEVYKNDMEGIEQIIQYGIHSGTFQPYDTEISAYGLMAMFIGLSFFRVVGFRLKTGMDNRRVCDDYIEKMLGTSFFRTPK